MRILLECLRRICFIFSGQFCAFRHIIKAGVQLFSRDNCGENDFLLKPVAAGPAEEYEVIIRDENCDETSLRMSGKDIEKGIPLRSSKPGESFSPKWKTV